MKTQMLHFLFFTVISVACCAQSYRDSTLINLGFKLRDEGKIQESTNALEQARLNFEKKGDFEGAAEMWYSIGLNYSFSRNTPESQRYFKLSLHLAQEKKLQLQMIQSADALSTIAGIKEEADDYIFYDLIRKQGYTILKDTCNLLRCNAELMLSYTNVGKIDSATYYFREYNKYAKACLENGDRAHALNEIGCAFQKIGDFDGSINFLTQSLYYHNIRKDSFDTYSEGVLNNVGFSFLLQQNYPKAEEYYTKSIELGNTRKIKQRTALMQSYIGLSTVKKTQGDTAKSIELTKQAIELNKKNTLLAYKLTTYQQLANTYIEQNNLPEAKILLDDLIGSQTKFPIVADRMKTYLSLGAYFLKSKKPREATYWLKGALDTLIKVKNGSTIPKAFALLARAYSENNQPDSAYYYLQSAEKFTDSLNRKKQLDLTYAIESRFELAEKNTVISTLNSDNKSKTEKLTTSYWRIGFLIFGIVALSVLSFYTFGLLRTKQQQAQELTIKNTEIQKIASDKDLLLREIHHRVKNNLQVVSSLLRLQSRQVEDVNAQEALKEGRNRVQSMSLIHQLLYTDADLTKIEAKDYIEKLSRMLYQSYEISNQRIALKVDVDNIKLDVDKAIPVGLILNELITNALKHAFPDKRIGSIEVAFKNQMNDTLLLSVIDDGVGLKKINSERSGVETEKSFGWDLIKLFTEKLEGEIKIRHTAGTNVQIVFPCSALI